MKNLFQSVLLVLSVAISSAAETVAWKCPLTTYAPRGFESDGIARIDTPPEPSAFFDPGDEIWDLSAIERHFRGPLKPSPEWIVWNATSKRIIAKAHLNTIYQLDLEIGKENIPSQCRVTAELFSVSADGFPLSNDAIPEHSVSWVTRSGRKSECESTTEEGSIRVNAEVVSSDLYADGRFQITCSLPNQKAVEISTSLTFTDAVPLWVARSFDGTKGVDLRITTRHILSDGSSYSAAVLHLVDGEAVPVPRQTHDPQIHKLPSGGMIYIVPFSVKEMGSFLGNSVDDIHEVDPFADTDPAPLKERLGLEEIAVPENLTPWFPGNALDLTGFVEGWGIPLDKSSGFAGYDPLTQRIFVFTKSKSDLDIVEQIFVFGCDSHPKVIATSINGSGMIRLLARSGIRASLQNSTRSFTIEPVIGDSDELIDSHITMKDEPAPKLSFSFETSMTLRAGVPLEFLVQGNEKISITADILLVEHLDH